MGEKPSEPDDANAGEGASPGKDIKKQNPGETTTEDIADKPSSPDKDGPGES